MSYYPSPPPRPQSYQSSYTGERRTYHSPNASRSLLPPQQPQREPFLTPVYSSKASYDPKAVTNAARNPAPPKPQPSAPYVHLDFHTNLADARKEGPIDDSVAPVSRRAIHIVRYINIFLRILQCAGAMGLLVLLLFMRKMEDVASWICRVPPAVATVHSFYAIYHHSGSHRLLQPASAKSYLLFSSTVDLAIVSFYGFTGALTWQQHAQYPRMDWTTIFADTNLDGKIVFSVFLLCCAAGGLTFISLVLGFYLLRCFRILCNLPPDMNPFVISEKAEKVTADKKRWSASTGASEVTAPFLAGTERKLNFADSRPGTGTTAADSPRHTPAPGSEGKYSYPVIDFARERDEIDLADTHSYREGDDSNRLPKHPSPEEFNNSAAATAAAASTPPKPPAHRHLKRGSVANSISSFESLGSYAPAQSNRYSTPPGSPTKRGLTPAPMPDSPIRIDSPKSRTKVQGFNKNSLLPNNSETRFRKVSNEAH